MRALAEETKWRQKVHNVPRAGANDFLMQGAARATKAETRKCHGTLLVRSKCCTTNTCSHVISGLGCLNAEGWMHAPGQPLSMLLLCNLCEHRAMHSSAMQVAEYAPCEMLLTACNNQESDPPTTRRLQRKKAALNGTAVLDLKAALQQYD